MFKIETTITTATEAATAARVFARIAEEMGEVAAPVKSTRRTNKETAAVNVESPATNDPAAAYIAAGGTLPPAEPEPAPEPAPVAAAAPETPTAAAAAGQTRAEKLDELRMRGRVAGIAWLREVLATHKVKAVSELPEAVLDLQLVALRAQQDVTESAA